MIRHLLLVSVAVLFSVTELAAQINTLHTALTSIVSGKNARIGIAVKHLETGDTLTVGGKQHYPMQSVFKFHLGLAILKKVDEKKLSLDQKIKVTPADLLPNTWSPLRKKYPEGNVDIPLREILESTVSLSDNNGCDILFRLIGGPKKVNDYIHRLGVRDVAIKNTEEEMQKSWEIQFSNWTTPSAAVQLLELVYYKKDISASGFDLLWKMMEESPTGPKRLKGLLPAGTVVAHKTGTSGISDKGVMAAVNDIGIITLPDGTHVAIAVFVSDSKEEMKASEEIIARVAKSTWDYFVH